MKTIALLGNPSPNRYIYNWFLDAQELGYKAQLNNISGLTKNDIIIMDKVRDFDLSRSPATKILFFPDLIRTVEQCDEYLARRTFVFDALADQFDILLLPPNMQSIRYAKSQTDKPIYPILFGVYRSYFSFFPKKFPSKDIDLGFNWSLGSARRDQIAKRLKATRVKGYGQEMINGISRCRFALNAHCTALPNNEQRLTEIPLACTIPVSEPLSFPEGLSNLHWIPISDYPLQLSRKEYVEIVKHNVHAVRTQYNSLESLRMILSHV